MIKKPNEKKEKKSKKNVPFIYIFNPLGSHTFRIISTTDLKHTVYTLFLFMYFLDFGSFALPYINILLCLYIKTPFWDMEIGD